MKDYNLLLVTLQVNWDVLFRSKASLFKEQFILSFKQMEVLLESQMEGRLPHQNKLMHGFLLLNNLLLKVRGWENGLQLAHFRWLHLDCLKSRSIVTSQHFNLPKSRQL